MCGLKLFCLSDNCCREITHTEGSRYRYHIVRFWRKHLFKDLADFVEIDYLKELVAKHLVIGSKRIFFDFAYLIDQFSAG